MVQAAAAASNALGGIARGLGLKKRHSNNHTFKVVHDDAMVSLNPDFSQS